MGVNSSDPAGMKGEKNPPRFSGVLASNSTVFCVLAEKISGEGSGPSGGVSVDGCELDGEKQWMSISSLSTSGKRFNGELGGGVLPRMLLNDISMESKGSCRKPFCSCAALSSVDRYGLARAEWSYNAIVLLLDDISRAGKGLDGEVSESSLRKSTKD
jgi:hypothetical protein